MKCTSCSGDFCSPTTTFGISVEEGIEKKNYSLSVSLSCSDCSGYTIRVFFDDGRGKTYMTESQAKEGEQKLSINLSGFDISDGLVLIGFELSITGQQGFDIADTFSCNIYFDDYPDKVQGVYAVGENKKFVVRWNEHPDRDIKLYRVYYGYPESCSDELVDVEPRKTEVEITQIFGEEIKNGETYCGFVVAMDIKGRTSPPSDVFRVVPAHTIGFGKSGPPDENIGCIIAFVFGDNSKITQLLRKFKELIIKLPGGKSVVRAYYSASRIMIKALKGMIRFLFPTSYASPGYDGNEKDDGGGEVIAQKGGESPDKEKKNHFVWIGGSFSSFEKAGVINGRSAFSLAYGQRILFLDLSYGRELISFIRGNFLQLYAYGNVSISSIRGRRIFLNEGGRIGTSPEFASNIWLFPVEFGVSLFGEFVMEQIFVPFVSFGVKDFIFLESYETERGSVFGNIFGFSTSFGGMLLLDMFDRRSEALAKSDYRVKDTYIFAKASYSIVNFVRRKGAFFSLKRSKYFDFSSLVITFGVSIFM